MEDLIGTAADHAARDQKKSHNSIERVYFHLCNSKRLANAESEYQFLTLERGDLANPDLTTSASRKETFVCTSESSKLGDSVKQALLLGTRGKQAATDDFVAQPHQPVTKALWKPQGQNADNRELASFMAIKFCHGDFEMLPGCWASFLLQEGCLFKRNTADDNVYLSLGFKHRAAWGFRVEQESVEGFFRLTPSTNDMTAQDARMRMKEMVECHVGVSPADKNVKMESDWVAIPTTVCTSTALEDIRRKYVRCICFWTLVKKHCTVGNDTFSLSKPLKQAQPVIADLIAHRSSVFQFRS